MKLEQINTIVEDYESLLRLIRNKADLLLIFDLEKYYGINYADDIINKWNMAQDGDYIFNNKDIKYKRK